MPAPIGGEGVPPDSRLLPRVQLALAVAGLLMLCAVVPLALTGDGHARWQALSTVMHTGELPETRYSYLGPVFAAPAFLFDSRQTELWWGVRYNLFLLAAAAAAAWWLFRGRLGPPAAASFALLLVVGGMMPNHVRDFYGETFTAAGVAIGLALVLMSGRRVGWVPVVLGVANTPGTVAGLGLIAVWRFMKSRRYDGFAALAAAALLVLAENFIVRGDVLASGYARDHGARTVMPFSGRPGFSYPLLLGLASLLFSFGKGVLFFAPGLLLMPHARRHLSRAAADMLDAWGIFTLGVLLVYAQWWAWYGGWYWGPRFLLIAAFPSALAIAVALNTPAGALRQLCTALVALWTVWVGVSGVVFAMHGLDVCMANDYALEHLCWYAPEFSPLFRPLVIRSALGDWQYAWILLAAASAMALVIPYLWRTADALAELGRPLVKRLPPDTSS